MEWLDDCCLQLIDAVDRAAILNDAFSFLKSGHLSVDTVMDLLQYVERKVTDVNDETKNYCSEGEEHDRVPWLVITSNLKHIENLLADSPVLSVFKVPEKLAKVAVSLCLGL